MYPELRIDSWIPQVKALLADPNVNPPAGVDVSKGFLYIRKNTARRLVEDQIGPLSKAKSQSSRFLASWMIKMRNIGEFTDRSIGVIVDEYTRLFTRLHPIVEPSRLHHCIWKFILEDMGAQNPGNRLSRHHSKLRSETEDRDVELIPLPSDTYNIVLSIGDYLQTVDDNPEMDDACQDLASIRANEYLKRLFGARDGEPLEFVNIYHPEFLMDHIAEWANSIMPWMNVFSDAVTDEYHHSDTNDVCCYWCLKKNPRDRRRYKRIPEGALHVIPSSSIVIHLIQCHPDYLGRRPQDPLGEGWVNEYREREIPSDPKLWNYSLEDLPKESPESLGYPDPMRRWTYTNLTYA
ncbi:hypothetical protein TWF281_010934 [Arthrobotrys megalospora]